MKILVVCTTDSMVWNFLIPHIQYWKRQGDKVEIVCARTGFYFDELRDQIGFRMHEIPFERSPFRICNIRAYRMLSDLIRKRAFEVVVSQEPVGGVLGRLAGWRNGAKNVYTAHGFHFFRGAPVRNWLLFYPVERLFSYITDVLITINREDYARAQSFGARSLVRLDGIGVDLRKYTGGSDGCGELRKELGAGSETKIILTVAELIHRKNYETALRAVARIRDRDILYLICGDGELKESLRRQCVELGIDSKVRFLGFRRDVNRLYRAADVFFFPSHQEGLSIALIEAMSSGLPVVCSRIRGNTDLVAEKQGGYLFAPEDDQGLADGLIQVLDGPSREMGAYNREHVKKFDIERIVPQFYAAIREAVT